MSYSSSSVTRQSQHQYGKLTYFLSQLTNKQVKLITFFISLLISCIILSHQQPFNVDGLAYLASAKAYINHGIASARGVYDWVAYPLVIAWTAQLTHLSLLHSALLLATLMLSFSTLVYLKLVEELGATRRTLLLAAIVILTYPYLNHYRDNVLRGSGYLLFSLLSISYLIQYAREFRWHKGFAWGLSLCIAILFRVEGILMLAFAPWLILLKPDNTLGFKLKQIIKIYSPFIFFVILLIMLIAFIEPKNLTSLKLSTFQRPFMQFLLLTVNAKHYVDAGILEFSKQYAIAPSSPFLFVRYLGHCLVGFTWKFIATLTPFYLLLSAYALYQKLTRSDWAAKTIILSIILLNVLMLIAYYIQLPFLVSKRYYFLTCILILTFAPFSIDKIYQYWRKPGPKSLLQRVLFPGICLAFIYLTIASLGHFGTSKAYIMEAGNWVKQNIPKSATIIVNKRYHYHRHDFGGRLAYYTQHNTNRIDINTGPNTFSLQEVVRQQSRHNKVTYYVLQVKRNDQHLNKQIAVTFQTSPLNVFKNKKGDKVVIYRYQAKNSRALS